MKKLIHLFAFLACSIGLMAADAQVPQVTINRQTRTVTNPDVGITFPIPVTNSAGLKIGGEFFFTTSELTVSAGSVSFSHPTHTVDTESDDSSDDLDTINFNSGTPVEFATLVLRPASGDRTVVLKHGTDNILCAGGADISLDDSQDVALGFYDLGTGKWHFGLVGGGVSGGGSLNNVVEDTSPQLGGTLDLNSQNVSGLLRLSTTIGVPAITLPDQTLHGFGWYVAPGNLQNGTAGSITNAALYGHGTIPFLYGYSDAGGNSIATIRGSGGDGYLRVINTVGTDISGIGIGHQSSTDTNIWRNFVGTASLGYPMYWGWAEGNIALGNTTPLITVATNGNTTFAGSVTSTGGFSGDGSALTALNASALASGTVADARLSATVANLDQAETITGNWVNTANPWADNEVSDTITVGASGSVNDAAIPSGVTRDTEWDMAAKINSATTDDDFVTLTGTQTVSGNKTFTGLMNMTGATIRVAGSAMASTNVAWTVPRNTYAMSGDTYFDLDAAGAATAGDHTKLVLTGHSSAAIITFDKDVLDLSNDQTISTGISISIPANANLELQLIYDGTTYRVFGLPILQTESFTFTIATPDEIQAETDDVVLKKFVAEKYPRGVTITAIHIDASSAYTSETFLFEHWDDASGSTQATVESIACSAISTEDDGTLSDATIPADYFLVVNLDDTPEDVSYVAITVTYTID